MATARYWRVLLRPFLVGTTAEVVVSKIEFRDSVGGSDLTGSGAPSAGESTFSGSAENLFDSDDSTIWWSSVGTNLDYPHRRWVRYDFGSPVEVLEFAVRTANSPYNTTSYRPGAVCLQYSDDGLNWNFASGWLDMSGVGAGGAATFESGALIEPTFDYRVANLPLLLPTEWPGPAFNYRKVGDQIYFDSIDGGSLRIAGTVAIDDTPDIPVRRRVRLHDKPTGRVIRETWSDPVTGAYEFTKLRAGVYYVTSFDHTGEYNAVIKDGIEPEIPT